MKWKVRDIDEKASFRKEHRRMKNKYKIDYVKREKKRERNRAGTRRRKRGNVLIKFYVKTII